ncbi:Qat anti-phage system QueC-like protein QatC [Pontibacter sp. MBLB2868]|uniref:Qat anti-phage system QueC-like protein QatC n=1 Tax=Pontibacter sp. MBLB2868 TaxID=3451555 RepID=UPI003F756EBB
MRVELNITSPTAIDVDGNLSASITYNDPRSTPHHQTQRANVSMRCSEILSFCAHAPSKAFDLFFLAACAYGIDRLIERRPYSTDGWSRELKMTVPVIDLSVWSGKEQETGNILSFLTGDYWEVEFTQSSLVLPSAASTPLPSPNIDHVNLFSGGLDSLIGAVDFLSNEPTKRLLLISHYDVNMNGPKGDQIKLYDELTKKYSQPIAWSKSVGIYLENATNGQRENTLRSRSLLFIALAVLAANSYGNGLPIWVPENGSVSLNYPLSPSRRTACSTRTTHPRLLKDIRQLLTNLGLASDITNPYELMTKGEMVEQCADRPFLMDVVNHSNSCGKRGHRRGWFRSASHCGVCMPCVYRRAALVGYTDPTTYGINLEELEWNATRTRLVKKRGQDLDACLEFLGMDLNNKQIQTELILNGVNDLDSLPEYSQVVERTREELKDLIRQNPDQDIRKKAGIL